MRYKVIGTTGVYWDVMVEADSEEEAIEIAENRAIFDIDCVSTGDTNIGDTELTDSQIYKTYDD